MRYSKHITAAPRGCQFGLRKGEGKLLVLDDDSYEIISRAIEMMYSKCSMRESHAVCGLPHPAVNRISMAVGYILSASGVANGWTPFELLALGTWRRCAAALLKRWS